MESYMGWVISWPVSHKFCLSANHFSECLPYSNIFEYSNMKLNEYAIFEYCKNLYSLDALVKRRSEDGALVEEHFELKSTCGLRFQRKDLCFHLMASLSRYHFDGFPISEFRARRRETFFKK